MKNKKNFVLLAFVLLAGVLVFYFKPDIENPFVPEPVKEPKRIQTKNLDNYLGSYKEGNYVWGGAMNLAWTELGENIIGGQPMLATKDKAALEIINSLNNAPFSKEDMDEESYYVKSGYGQETVDTINKESRKKFPTKSFADLDLTLADRDIISYAYFLKEVEYVTQFKEGTVTFEGEVVPGFKATEDSQKDNVLVVKYESDDKFIVKLALKDKGEELFLAKGYDMDAPKEAIMDIAAVDTTKLPTIKTSETFSAPELHLDHNRSYGKLVGLSFLNKGFEKYFIGAMFENIKFDMDEKGARVENEAVIAVIDTAIMSEEKTRRFELNAPYWVIMKQTDSPNPYFILGVNNTFLMTE